MQLLVIEVVGVDVVISDGIEVVVKNICGDEHIDVENVDWAIFACSEELHKAGGMFDNMGVCCC